MHSISVIPFHQNFLEGNQASSVILGHIHGDEKNTMFHRVKLHLRLDF